MNNVIKYKTETEIFNVNYEIFKPNDVEKAIKNYRSEMGKEKIFWTLQFN